MSDIIEYWFHDKGRAATLVTLREERVKKGIEARLARIEIHPVDPPQGEKVFSYSKLNEILSRYKNKADVLKEIERTNKFPGTVIIGN